MSLAYLYDATGKKLKKTKTGSGAYITDYLDGIHYTNSAIEFIQTEEGIARNNSGTYNYAYNLTDHLGNVRASFQKHPSTGLIDPLQRDDYYAFGKQKPVAGGTNKYLYNGKELQEELNQYDYGARFYDAEIGRWQVVDPVTEKYYGINPYSSSLNNPSSIIDPDGRDVEIGNLKDEDHVRALIEFLKTQNGRAFINNYMKKGQSLELTSEGKTHVYTAIKDGEFSNDILAIGSAEDLGVVGSNEVVGRTTTNKPSGEVLDENSFGEKDATYDVRKKVVEQIWLKTGGGLDKSIMTLGHEAFVHAVPDMNRLRELRQELSKGTIKPGTKLYEQKLNAITRSGSEDHKNLLNNAVHSYRNFSQQMDVVKGTTKFIRAYNEDTKQ